MKIFISLIAFVFLLVSLSFGTELSADERATGAKSAQLGVSVTVVRGNDTSSPETVVQEMQCVTRETGETLCSSTEVEESSIETSAQCLPATESGVCWY